MLREHAAPQERVIGHSTTVVRKSEKHSENHLHNSGISGRPEDLSPSSLTLGPALRSFACHFSNDAGLEVGL